MKLVQLLTGAAAAALLAGASFAQTVTIETGASAFDGDLTVASEFEGALAGNLVFDLDFDAAFATLGAGGEVDMIVTLTNANFTGIVTDNPSFTDTDCDFVIQSGGGAEGTSVTFRSSSAALQTCSNGLGTDAESTLTLPIEVTNIGESASVSVQFVRNSGSAGYTGGTTEYDLVDYVAATSYSFTANPDASELLATGGTLIDWSAVSVAGDEGFLGSFAAAAITDIDPGAGVLNPAYALAGTQLNDYDIALTDSSTVVFTFESVTGVTGIDLAGAGGLDLGSDCASPDAVNNTITCTLTGADVNDSIADAITFTLDLEAATAVTAPQTIAVEFTPDLDTGFADTGASDADFALLDEDDGVFTTVIAAEFPWSALRTTGGTKSAFRITGLEASPSVINVILNSTYVRDGGTAPTESTVDITSIADIQEDPLNAGQFIATFTSEDIASLLGTAGGVNADLQFSVVLPDNTGVGSLEALRLLSTGGVVAGTGFDG